MQQFSGDRFCLKLKNFLKTISNVIKLEKFIDDTKKKNIEGKVRIALYEQFFLFSQIFHKSLCFDTTEREKNMEGKGKVARYSPRIVSIKTHFPCVTN